jgi:hypothetical protein
MCVRALGRRPARKETGEVSDTAAKARTRQEKAHERIRHMQGREIRRSFDLAEAVLNHYDMALSDQSSIHYHDEMTAGEPGCMCPILEAAVEFLYDLLLTRLADVRYGRLELVEEEL